MKIKTKTKKLALVVESLRRLQSPPTAAVAEGTWMTCGHHASDTHAFNR